MPSYKQIVDPLGNPIVSKNGAATKGYDPGPRHILGREPRDLPLFTFQTIQHMLQEPMIRLGLAMRAAPIASMEFAYQEQGEWIPGVKADKEPVKNFIERQLHRIWKFDIHKLLNAQLWGWAACEVLYKVDENNGMIEFDTMLDRHPRDVRALEHEGGMIGVQFQRIGTKNKTNITRDHVNLGIPGRAIWHAHMPEHDSYYGTSICYGAYSPWADKWFNGGALDVRRLYMQSDSYSSMRIGYPPGTTEIDGKGEVPNRDIAREIEERHLAGNVIAYPLVYDSGGNLLWKIDDAKTSSNPGHILQYPKDIDVEILRGMEIPDDVLTSEGMTGAWKGKAIPAQAFYQGLNQWGYALLQTIIVSILEPLVKWNFGKAEDFEISFKPFDVQAMEQQNGPEEQQGPQNQLEQSPGGFGQQDQQSGFAPLSDNMLLQGNSQAMSLGAQAHDIVNYIDRIIESRIPETRIANEVKPKLYQSDTIKRLGLDHKFSSTQFDIPAEISQFILAMTQKIDSSDLAEDGFETEPHVTVLYGLQSETPEQVAHVLRDEGPIAMRLGKTSIFECDDHDVVKIDVESVGLHRMHEKLSKACPHKQTHPSYVPHITLAYVKPGRGMDYIGMPDMEGTLINFNELTFSSSNGERCSIELNGPVRFSTEKLNSKNLAQEIFNELEEMFESEISRMSQQARAPAGFTESDPLVIDGKSYIGGKYIPAETGLGQEEVDEIAKTQQGKGEVSDESTDEDLMMAFKNGNKKAMSHLYDRYQNRFRREARQRVSRVQSRARNYDQMADNALQEAFVTIMEKADKFDPSLGNFKGWAGVILNRAAIDQGRSNARRRTREQSESVIKSDEGKSGLFDRLYDEASSTNPSDIADLNEQKEKLKGCMEDLNERYRDVVTMKYRGAKQIHIAQEMGVSNGTITNWLAKAHAALHECLKGKKKGVDVRMGVEDEIIDIAKKEERIDGVKKVITLLLEIAKDEDEEFSEPLDTDPPSFESIEKMAGKATRMEANPEWTKYQGNRGGSGWQNSRTGEVVYQDEPPGADEKKTPRKTVVDKTFLPEGGEKENPANRNMQPLEKTDKGWGKLPPHFEGVKIPPAWKGVQINMNPNADLLAIGEDKRGNTVSLYSAKHHGRKAAIKYDRIRELKSKIGSIDSQLKSGMENPETSEAAFVASVIRSTGIRPGSSDKRIGRKKAYGAVTLEGRHVFKGERGVRLQFQGKKGVKINVPVTDPELAEKLVARAEKVGRKEKLFGISYKELDDYVDTLDGGSFNSKDFRTLIGTETAVEEINKVKRLPSTIKRYKELVTRVAKAVSKRLGNTPAVALTSYIDPVVWQKWQSRIPELASRL